MMGLMEQHKASTILVFALLCSMQSYYSDDGVKPSTFLQHLVVGDKAYVLLWSATEYQTALSALR